MTRTKGNFANTDTTGVMSEERIAALKLPPTRKACREGTCVLTESENLPGRMIRAWCPYCGLTKEFSMYQREREGA